MTNLTYLFAAYSAVWLIMGFYLFVLIQRNRKLGQQVDQLEKRIQALVKADREAS